MSKLSIYIDAPLIKRGRKIGALAADFLLCLILSLLLFFASDAINTGIGGFNAVGSELLESEQSMRAQIKESRLDKETAQGNLMGVERNATIYVLTLTYASLLEGGMDEASISHSTYNGYQPITPETDGCYFYYSAFKNEKEVDFAGNSNSRSLASYLSALKDNRPYFIESGYPYLALETAKKIDESYRNPSYSEGKAIREDLFQAYKGLLIEAIEDFESGYKPYIAAKESYLASYQKLLTIKIAEAFTGYAIASLLLYVLIPLIARNGRTIGNLVFKSAYRRNSGKEPAFWQITLRFLVLLLEFAGTAPIALLLVYGKEGVNLLSLMLFGFLPCFTLVIYSLVVCLLSYLLSFFFKKRKQTLSEMASGLIHVDGRKSYEI